MKPLPDLACFLPQLILIYLGINMVYSQDHYRNYDDPHVQAAQGNQQSMELDYDNSMYDVTEEKYFCYSCTYHVRQGNVAGHENCRDPFIETDIPKVECSGSCAKIYQKTSETDYTITRNCLPNCKDLNDNMGYTQCCMGSLCNGGASSKAASCIVLSTGVAASTWYIYR